MLAVYLWNMADLGMLFTLILVALTFVIVGMCFIVYIMIIGEREKRAKAEAGGSDSQSKQQRAAGCAHSFGYLSHYPRNQPIPEECFGCMNAIQCVNSKTQATEVDAADGDGSDGSNGQELDSEPDSEADPA